jgi:hypothetical protein
LEKIYQVVVFLKEEFIAPDEARYCSCKPRRLVWRSAGDVQDSAARIAGVNVRYQPIKSFNAKTPGRKDAKL